MASPNGRTEEQAFQSGTVDAFSLPPLHEAAFRGEFGYEGGASEQLSRTRSLRWGSGGGLLCAATLRSRAQSRRHQNETKQKQLSERRWRAGARAGGFSRLSPSPTPLSPRKHTSLNPVAPFFHTNHRRRRERAPAAARLRGRRLPRRPQKFARAVGRRRDAPVLGGAGGWVLLGWCVCVLVGSAKGGKLGGGLTGGSSRQITRASCH